MALALRLCRRSGDRTAITERLRPLLGRRGALLAAVAFALLARLVLVARSRWPDWCSSPARYGGLRRVARELEHGTGHTVQ